MYYVGDIFYLDDDYDNKVAFCNANNYRIIEIEPDENGRRFQIQDQPLQTIEESIRSQISALENWFAEIYDVQIQQYMRCQRLGIEYDNKHGTVSELDSEAIKNSERIKELRALLE